jgi:hypothetical protein
MVQCLTSKCKALILNHSTAKGKKREEKKKGKKRKERMEAERDRKGGGEKSCIREGRGGKEIG